MIFILLLFTLHFAISTGLIFITHYYVTENFKAGNKALAIVFLTASTYIFYMFSEAVYGILILSINKGV